MGFICERYSDNRAGLMVRFSGDQSSANYYAGDSANDAMEHFNLYLEDGIIYAKTDDEMALETVGVQSTEEAHELREKIDSIINAYTDEQAADNVVLFPKWIVDKQYLVGNRVRHNGKLYKVLQAHTSQADWTPDVAVSLFAEILTGEDDKPKPWEKPDSTNPYMAGDKVIFNDMVYESLIDNNLWSPDEYPAGWRVVE